MMSKKQWLALLAVFVTYLLLGAAIFYHIEEPLEHQRRQEERNELWQIHNLLSHLNYSAELIGTLEKYCHKPMVIRGEEPELEPMLWNFYNSFFFVITVVSTIGYGNLAPTCPLSRILMILYALIGIPINGILLASLGEFFSITLLRARHRHKHESATLMIMDIMRYLVPGFIVFIFLPAAVFTYVEHEWTYDMGVYYAFVTLTTIGFGDLVAGQSSRGQGGVFVVYRIALIVWVVFGLGYLVMLLGFITRAMRSKKMARLEHKLAENLRMTQSKIWNGFTKDMAYLRRIINEMYLQKLKPVYRDEDTHPKEFQRTRSNSEPTLSISSELQFAQGDAGMWRRRANSEVIPERGIAPLRVLSESDLCRIDKDATFATATMIEPVEFLTRFVTALGGGQEYIEEQDETERKYNGGIHGFTDEEILASEKWAGSGWTLGGSDVPRQQPIRGRAASEVRITMPDDKTSYNAEWTWSGDVASRRIHELIRARRKSIHV
ncbi:open rectifier potassium channel protein 1 isoform X2 [Anabrus simplex]|uniref:open rectifier potassium channel protein 1 isoform X2 n=1 Tax=Anabrus simplex TaxID=316456 RepID=UPI0035A38681